jgi:hypothetical protein
MTEEVMVRVAEDGADVERLADLSEYLRRELVALDVEDVEPLRSGPAPAGTRGMDAVTVGTLVVSLGQTAQGLFQVVTAVRDWLQRGQGHQRRVRLEIDGDALELSGGSREDHDRLIELFVSRHGAGGAT